MKRYFLIPTLILIVGITACSPVTASLEAHALGETLRQAQDATLGQSATTVDAETEVEADNEADAESTMTPAQEAALRQAQDVTPETSSEQETVSEQHVEPLPTMPIITETHQGFTYRPGQVVAVLAEGFEAGDTLAVTLVHETHGQVDTHFVSPVSSRGNIPIYLPVEIEEAGTYPDGEYTFRVSGSDGTRKTYTFSLDFLTPADTAPFEGCGVYPEPMLESIAFVWCTGYAPSVAPLDIRGVVNGEELFTDVVDTIYSDGVALYVLDIFDNDPAGEWMLEIGQDELTINVTEGNHE